MLILMELLYATRDMEAVNVSVSQLIAHCTS